jgi:hypothetical protein
VLLPTLITQTVINYQNIVYAIQKVVEHKYSSNIPYSGAMIYDLLTTFAIVALWNTNISHPSLKGRYDKRIDQAHALGEGC